MKKSVFVHIIIVFLSCIRLVNAQGDDCSNAYQLTNVINYCSGAAAFTNSGTTTSSYSGLSCWTAASTMDVWFVFTATGSDIMITASGSGAGGTMNHPRITLMSGTCGGTITENGCASGTAGSGTTQLYHAPLTVGNTYYICISTTTAQEGSFELCVNNYTPSANPGADCDGAAYLCNTNPVSVGALSGAGINVNEPEASSCMYDPFGSEGNSSWYYWTCETSGTLTFDITPSNNTDDIDWLLYKINGTNVCGSRTILRCNAASCLGPNGSTGINMTDTDISENPGCTGAENAYCQYINMVAGTTYALLVNNWSASNGFTLNFGGTGTFLGPKPVITANPTSICSGSSVVFDGSSSTNVAGGLSWNFNNGGSPTTATGNGPHTITYSAPGSYVAILTGNDSTGCTSTVVQNILVNSPPSAPTVSNVTYCVGSSANALTATGSNLLWYTSATGGVGSSTAPTPSTASAGVTSYYVSQSNSGCEGPRAQIDVTVNDLPVISVNSATICGGSSVTLTASGANTYTWSPSTGLNTTTGSSVIASPSVATIYTVTGTANACQSSAQSTVSIAPSLVMSVNSESICTGNSATLTASGATSYTWSPSTGLSSASGSSVVANPTITTVYTISGEDGGGCTGSVTATVTVNQLPSLIVNSDSICVGDSTQLIVSGASTYSWSPSMGLASTTGSAVMASPLVNTVYTITGTDSNGCVDSVPSTIAVTSLPIVTVNSGSICLSQNMDLTANGATTYTWAPPTGLSATNSNPVTASPSTTTVYTVTGTTNGCSSSAQSTVTVIPSTPITVNSPSYCIGQSATLTATGSSNYSWSPATGLSATTGASVTANPTVTTVYTITENASGCNYTTTSTVTVHSLPVVTVSNDSPACENETINLSSGGGLSYSWSGPASYSSTNQNPVINSATLPMTGVYTVTVTDINSCVNTGTTSVTVNPVPVPTISNDTALCENGTVNLTASGGNSYQWMGPGNFLSTNQNPVLTNVTPSMSGIYAVTVSNANCTATGTASITVNPLPIPIISSNSPLCIGNTLTLSASGGANYLWNGPNTFSSSTASAQITNATTVASGTYSLTVTDNNGCLADTTIVIVVNPLPSAPVGMDVTYCQNVATVPLTATSSAGGSLNWYGTDPSGPSTTSPTIPSVSTVGTFYYYVSQSVLGCEGPIDTISVLVNQLPTGVLNTIPVQCAPLCDTFVFSSASVITSWAWNMGDASLSTNNDSVAYCYSKSGIYSVAVTIKDNNNCTNTVPFNSWVNVAQIPIADFYYTPEAVSVFDPSVTFVNQSVGIDIVSDNWQITFNDTLLFSTTEPNQFNYLFPDTGIYSVSLTVVTQEGCIDTKVKPIVVMDEMITYIPNAFSPDNDGINEVFMAYGVGIVSCELLVFDRWGEMIYKGDGVKEGWNGKLKNNKVEEGIYVYRFEFLNKYGDKSVKTGHVTVVR